MRAKHLPIASPCHEDWDAMRPTGCGKHCQACDKPVYDLSAMTETRARALLAKNAKREICISYLFDDQGNVSFRAPKKAPVVAAAVVATALAACTPIHNADVVPDTTPAAIEPEQPALIEDVMVPLAEREPEPQWEPEEELEPAEPVLVRVKGDWAGPVDEPCDPPEARAKKPKKLRRIKGGKPAHSISIE